MNPLGESSSDLPIISPANMLPVEVICREEIAPEVVALSVALPGSEQAPAPYLPGQFVTLAIPTPRQTIHRSYSLIGTGDPNQPWQIAVKRLQQGTVSSYLYDVVEEGALLYASLPRGTFVLPADLPPGAALIFVAVGSGITPIMGMLSALALLPDERRPQVRLHYASRSPSEIIFRRELRQLDPKEHWLQQWHYLASDGNRMTPEAVVAKVGSLARRAHWYMCGPETLKRDLQGLLEEAGVPDEYIHAEIFISQAARSASTGATSARMPAIRASGGLAGAGENFQLTVQTTGATLNARPSETLLEALERQGYHPEFSCRAGACGVCKLRVLSGQAAPVGDALTAAEKRAGYVLSCVARPQGNVTLAAGGRPPVGGVGTLGAGAVPGGNVVLLRRQTALRLRAVTALAVGGLVFGAWLLTNHLPPSLASGRPSNTGAPATQQAGGTNTPGSTATAGNPASGPTATLAPGATATPTPTPTLSPGMTATPARVPPTATPKPKPPAPTPTTKSGASSTPTH
jgi:ferredoxin-NADP reductase